MGEREYGRLLSDEGRVCGSQRAAHPQLACARGPLPKKSRRAGWAGRRPPAAAGRRTMAAIVHADSEYRLSRFRVLLGREAMAAIVYAAAAAVGPHCGCRDSNIRPGVCLQGVRLAACADPERAQECAHGSVPTGDGHSVGAGPGPGTCHGLARGPVRVRVRRAVTPAGPMASVTRLRCPTSTQVPAFKLPPGPRGPSPDPTRTSEWAGFDPGRADPDRTPARFCCRRP